MVNKEKGKLLLFDYDGTLVDSAKMIVDGTIEAFNRCGLATPKPEEIAFLEDLLLTNKTLPVSI